MSIALILSVALGGIAVIQAGINRQIIGKWGIAPGVVLNNLVIFILGLLLYLVVRLYPDFFPSNMRLESEFTQLKWWYLIPGLCGLCLVGGIPVLMGKIGAAKVFVAIIVGQLLLSLLWDMVHESIPLTLTRTLGAVLAIIGVVLVNWKV
jgi:bacterial/archaeal transporter family-2 protein